MEPYDAFIESAAEHFKALLQEQLLRQQRIKSGGTRRFFGYFSYLSSSFQLLCPMIRSSIVYNCNMQLDRCIDMSCDSFIRAGCNRFR